MKILVCGGRNYKDKEALYAFLDDLDGNGKKGGITAVVHGAAPGADTLAGEWAADRNRTVYSHPAQWDIYGSSAGSIRNAQMLLMHPDIEMVIAFPGGRDTQDMINKAKEKGIMVHQVEEGYGKRTQSNE